MKRIICIVITIALCMTSCYALSESEKEPYNITFSSALQLLNGLTQDDIYSDVATAVMSAIALYLDIAKNEDIQDVSSTDVGLLLQNEIWIGKKDGNIIIGGYENIFGGAIFLFYNPDTTTAIYRYEVINKDYQSAVSAIMKEISDECYIIDKDIVQEALLTFYSTLK